MNIYIIKVTDTRWTPTKSYIDSAWENLEDAKEYIKNAEQANTFKNKIAIIETIRLYKHYYIRQAIKTYSPKHEQKQ